MELKHKIDKLIFTWVKDNFGENEAHDPSWSIVELASYLADHLHELDIDPDDLSAYTKSNVYSTLDQHYVEEDVEQYADDRGIKLTEQQVRSVADKIRSSDWYCSINAEDMEYYINEELKKEKQDVNHN